MTIKELENRTGMARANIRFYEEEGLLSPKRLPNGYRDYSEEDAGTLEKIKLLRQLQLDIDTIRKVQGGVLTLEQALFTQLTKLEGDKAVLERAAAVCRELERSGVEYAALEPQPWLEQLAAPSQRSQLPNPASPAAEESREEEPRACWHPWQRFFARTLDMSLYGMLFNALWLVVFRDQSTVRANGLMSWILGTMLLAFTLAVEPFWLHCWGWTPGKWVFGLKLRNEAGGKLTLAQGFRRSYAVAWDGYGLNFPIWSLWKMWQGRSLGLESRDCPWDGEEGYRYTKVERKLHGGWALAGVLAAYTVALVLCLKYTQTPVNQGTLTVKDFSENYNYYFKQFIDQRSTGLPTMDGSGRWVEREHYADDAVIYLFGDTTVWDDPVFALSGDQVLGITLHMVSEDSFVTSGSQEQLALLAMSGAVDGLNLFNYNLRGWVNAYMELASAWVDADFTYRGLHITQQVEYEGYSTSGSDLWQMGDDVPRHCEKTVTISLSQP